MPELELHPKLVQRIRAAAAKHPPSDPAVIAGLRGILARKESEPAPTVTPCPSPRDRFA